MPLDLGFVSIGHQTECLAATQPIGLNSGKKPDIVKRILCFVSALFACAFCLLSPSSAFAQRSHPASGLGTLGGLILPREGTPKHDGSWDRKGGNADMLKLEPGESRTIWDYKGAGIVRRFWVTIAPRSDKEIHRQLILQMYWDDEPTPSVVAPIGDFFGVGFGEQKDYQSLPLNEISGGYNCYWAMPFHKSARWTLTNMSKKRVDAFYFNLDFTAYARLPKETLHFHAQWRRENPTTPGQNYTILDAKGRGHFVGVALFMQNRKGRGLGFLEGDEMIYLEGEEKPSIIGTGAEDYFSSGWYYDRGEYGAPYHGVNLKDTQTGRISTYRWHIEDAMPFQKSIKVTIEHGNQNDHEGDYSSVAYCDRTDRWKVGEQLAQTDKVTELLEALSKLEAKTPADRTDDGTPPAEFAKLNGFTVKVTAQAKAADGDTQPAPRTYTLSLAARNPATKKLAVIAAGRPRVSLVDDSVVSLAERGPLAYRSRRLFDTAEMKLDTLTVKKPDGGAYSLASVQSKWTLTAPMKLDPEKGKANRLTADVSGLEAVEYVTDKPTAGEWTEFGLAEAIPDILGKPNPGAARYFVDLTFTGVGAKADQLVIGKERVGKGDCYARLRSTGGVFTVSKAFVDSLDKGPLDLLPLQLWTSTPDKVQAVTVGRGKETYTVRRDDRKWKLSGPFDADASAFDAEPLTAGVAAPRAERYDAVTADPVKHGLSAQFAPLAGVAGGAVGDLAPSMVLTVKTREKAKDGDDEETVTRTLLVGKVAEGAPPPPTATGASPPPGRGGTPSSPTGRTRRCSCFPRTPSPPPTSRHWSG